MKMKKTISLILAVILLVSLMPAIMFTVTADDNGFIAVSAGASHSVAIKSDGSLWAWGSNNAGQIGNGKSGWDEVELRPVKIMDNVIQVSAGGFHTMAIKNDGSLWAWGRNEYGQIGNGKTGNGNFIYETKPIKIMDDVKQVSAGEVYTLAIKSDGSLWAWGSNRQGYLGDGTMTYIEKDENNNYLKNADGSFKWVYNDKSKPVKIMDDVKQVSAGGMHSMAIKNDGSLWVWGDKTFGMLGNYESAKEYWDDPDREGNILTPVNVMNDVKQVILGLQCSFVIKNDDSLWAMGANAFGQFGDGNIQSAYLFPGKIMDNVKQVAAGSTYTMVIKTDGNLWACGDNGFGQIGDGTISGFYPNKDGVQEYVNNNKLSFVKIMDGVAQVSTSPSSHHTLAIKNDGTLWAWGGNQSGQIGDGTKETYNFETKTLDNQKISPVNITTDTPTSTTPTPIAPTPNPEIPAESATAKPSSQKVLVNGKEVAFDAYNINGSNYFKLRDLAYIFSGTQKQFAVGYDDKTKAITLTSGEAYTKVGGEMALKENRQNKTANPTTSKIYLDGKEIKFTVYLIDGNNYFKLRDVMKTFDIYVGYDDATKTITLDTSKGYVD